MIDILKKLIHFPTVTGNFEANNQALDYIASYVQQRGMHVEHFEWNNYRALVATTQPNRKNPTVMLAAHLDVVAAPAELFELRRQDGKLFGRGTLDMKFAIAAYLQIIDELGERLHDYDFGLMITTDEEAGGADGTEKLVEAGYLPKVCILPDGGDDWQMQLYSKGFLYLQITTQGTTAHGSRPWLGRNALLTLMDVIREIQSLFPELQGSETNTLNVGRMQAGNAINQVAAHAEASLDIRLVNEAERPKMLSAIQQICDHHQAKLTIQINGAACDFSLDDPYLAPFATLITKVTGVSIHGSRTLGSNDARFFAVHNVPCVSLYPPGGGHHGPHEWASEQGVYQFKEILQRYLEQIAKTDVPIRTS